MSWKRTASIFNGKDVIWERAGIIASNYECNNATSIRSCVHYNGSGSHAFGGAEAWPHLEISIDFGVGEEDKREKLIEKLKEFLDQNL